MNKILLLFIAISFLPFSKTEYSKVYFANGNLKEEGWLIDNVKNKYWFYYHESGAKKQEGHYTNNHKTDWWVFYDKDGNMTKKCEYKNNKLEGFSINYQNGEISSAEKYRQGKRIKYWTSMADFKKDNSDLF